MMNRTCSHRRIHHGKAIPVVGHSILVSKVHRMCCPQAAHARDTNGQHALAALRPHDQTGAALAPNQLGVEA